MTHDDHNETPDSADQISQDEHAVLEPMSPPMTPDEDHVFLDKPPLWPKVIGIISIVFASFGLLCGTVGGGLAVFLMPQMMSMASEGDPLAPTMVFGPMDYVSISISLLATVILLFAGISTVSRTAAGRTLHLTWAILAVPITLFATYLQFSKAIQLEQWIQDNPNNALVRNNAVRSGAMNLIGPVFGLVVGLAWPIFIMFWFGVVKRRPEDMTAGTEDVI